MKNETCPQCKRSKAECRFFRTEEYWSGDDCREAAVDCLYATQERADNLSRRLAEAEAKIEAVRTDAERSEIMRLRLVEAAAIEVFETTHSNGSETLNITLAFLRLQSALGLEDA